MNARYVPLPPRRALGTYWHMGMGRCGSGQETTPSSPYGELLSHASHATGSSYPACGEFISQDTPTRAICDMTDMRYDHEGRTRWGMLSLSPLSSFSPGGLHGDGRGVGVPLEGARLTRRSGAFLGRGMNTITLLITEEPRRVHRLRTDRWRGLRAGRV